MLQLCKVVGLPTGTCASVPIHASATAFAAPRRGEKAWRKDAWTPWVQVDGEQRDDAEEAHLVTMVEGLPVGWNLALESGARMTSLVVRLASYKSQFTEI